MLPLIYLVMPLIIFGMMLLIQHIGQVNGYKIGALDELISKYRIWFWVYMLMYLGLWVVNFRRFVMVYQITKGFVDTANINRQFYSDYILIPMVTVKKTRGGYKIIVEQLPNMAEDPLDNVSFMNSSLKGINKAYIVDDVMMSNDQTQSIYKIVDVNQIKRLVPKAKDELKTKGYYSIKLMEGLEWDIRKTPHALITGKTGSGKTTFIDSILFQFKTKQAKIKIIDVKREFVARGFDSKDCAIDVAGALAMIEEAVADMSRRQNKIAQESAKRGVIGLTGADLKFRPYLLVIDEIASLNAMMSKNERDRFMSKLLQLVMLGRSSLVNVILSTQQGNSKVVTTDVRDNLGLRVLLGSSSLEARRMVFGDGAKAVSGSVPDFQGYYEMLGLTNSPKIIKVPDLRGLE